MLAHVNACMACTSLSATENKLSLSLPRHIKGPGANVAIIGVGGLGHLALQFANAMGANVTAVDVDATKSEEAKGLGAHTFANFDEAVSTGPKVRCKI